jgi:hypothetical protein
VVQDEVAEAQPDIDKRTEQLVSKGRWAVPGYKVSFTFFPPMMRKMQLLTPPVGEVWRSVRPLSASFSTCLKIPPGWVWVVLPTYCE